jgi:hypothetical protein
VVVDEANVFTWPGFDLVPQAGGGFVRGVVTVRFFEAIRAAVRALRAEGRQREVHRDD